MQNINTTKQLLSLLLVSGRLTIEGKRWEPQEFIETHPELINEDLTGNGHAAIHYAAQCCPWALDYIIARTKTIARQTAFGDTALHYAAKGGYHSAVAALMKKMDKTQLNMVNGAGLTAIQEAAYFMRFDVIAQMIANPLISYTSAELLKSLPKGLSKELTEPLIKLLANNQSAGEKPKENTARKKMDKKVLANATLRPRH